MKQNKVEYSYGGDSLNIAFAVMLIVNLIIILL